MIKKYFKKRLELFKQNDVKGEILLNIGLGIFVNALFSITLGQVSTLIVFDTIFGIMLIIEGSILKKDITCK